MEDNVVNSPRRGAAAFGIDLVDVRTTEEERELIEHLLPAEYIANQRNIPLNNPRNAEAAALSSVCSG